MEVAASTDLGRLTRSASTPRRVLVVAAAGYGKTTALRSTLNPANARWFTGAEVIDDLAGLAAGPGVDWIVVDDLPDLPADRAERLVRAVAGMPEPVGLALVSRWPIPAPVSRWRGQGLLAEVGPEHLALPLDEVIAMLRAAGGVVDAATARRIHQDTGGWPALVRLAGEAVADGVAVPDLAAPGSAMAAYIADEVIAPLPGEVSGLLRAVADLAPIGTALCRALGLRKVDPAIELLTRTGLLHRGCIVPVVARVAGQRRRGGPARKRHRAAAAWYSRHGPPVAAALAHHRTGDDATCARILAEQGDELVASGEAATVADLIRALPAGLRDHRLRLLLGDALRTCGQTAAALATFAELADGAGALGADLAWRMAMAHYMRGEPRAALEVCGRAAAGAGDPADEAWLLSCAATAHWSLGAADDGLACARRACDRSAAGDDPRPRAAAHVAMALCLSLAGDLTGVDEHYAHAARFAEEAGDFVQAARTDVNRSHHLLADARYPEAARAARRAARATESGGPPGLLAVSLCNEGEALMRMCRYDDAVQRYERALTLARQSSTGDRAGLLAGAGEVQRRRGNHQQALGMFEEAVRLSRDSGDRQALVPALAGLAKIVADEDAAQGRLLATEAVSVARGSGVIPALLAAGHVAAVEGDVNAALAVTNRALERARQRGERGWLAEALELRAEVDADPVRRRASLAEAYGIWYGAGAAHDADRVVLALGRLTGANADDRLRAMLAAERLAAAGVVDTVRRVPGDRPAGTGAPEAGQVTVSTFGRFEVFVDDRPVPASAWQSRRARDLLRILVARRGRTVPRPELCELLWPDDDCSRTAHRLSVLLSIVRTVAGKEVLLADSAGVALDLGQVRVDVEEFLDDVAHGFRLHRRGSTADARSLLAAAERRFVGEPFDDAPYEDWAIPLREEARVAYLRTVRVLAELSRTGGEREQAASYLRRLLSVDPYDEAAHRALVALLAGGGRHGEARRALARYRKAMVAIGVRPPDHVSISA